MRNLKKILALVLAFMMVLSMMVTASAADFTDAEDISYVEAVDLMTALGILKGIPNANGTLSFDPTGKMDRGSAAAMTTYIALAGNLDLIAQGETKFTDVPAKYWASGYVNYCSDEGYIDGYNGKFFPNDNITVYGYAKLMLNALGIDGTYTGDGWELNVAKAAKEAGLLAGLPAGIGRMDITREQASQMAFNALNYSETPDVYEVRYTTDTKATYTVVGTYEDLLDASLYATVLGGYNGTSGYYVQKADAKDTILAEVFKTSKLEGIFEGHNAYAWAINGEEITDYYIGDVTLKTVYGNGASLASMTNKNSVYYEGVQMIGAPIYFYNGLSETTIGTNAIPAAAKLGSVIEFIDTDFDGICDRVNVIEKTVATLTADPTLSTAGNNTYVTMTDIVLASKNAKNVIGYEDVRKGDVVLYVHMDGGNTYIEKAESFVGRVTSNHPVYGALINGEYYYASGIPGTTYTDGSITKSDAYTIYLDNNSNIVKAAPVTATTTSAYAAVVDLGWVTNVGNLEIGNQVYAYGQAKLVFTDGTSKVVTIGSVNDCTLVPAGYDVTTLTGYASDNNDGSVDAGETVTVTFTNGTTAKYFGVDATTDITLNSTLGSVLPDGRMVVYSVNKDGTYNLSTTALTGNHFAALANSALVNGVAKFDGTNIGNAATVFVIETTDVSGKPVYTVYKGINELPNTALAALNQGQQAVVTDAKGIALYVYAKVGATSMASNDIVYIANKDIYSIATDTTTYIYDAIVNGVAQTITVDSKVAASNSFYGVNKIVDGVYTLTGPVGTVTGIKSTSGNTLVLGDGTAYTYDAESLAIVITNNIYGTATAAVTTVNALTLDATDDILVISANGKYADVVFVVKYDAEPGITVTAGTVTSATQRGTTNTYDVVASAAGQTVTIDVTALSNTSIKAISINGVSYTDNTAYAIAANGTYTVVVTIEDDFGHALNAYTYTLVVTGIPAV